MHQILTILTAIAPVFLLIALGIGLRRKNWLTEAADQTLLNLTINVLTPCLIFESILGNEALRSVGTLFLAPLLGAASIGIGYFFALLAARWLGLSNPLAARSFAFPTAVYNYGFIAIPVAVSLFNHETLGVLFLFNLGVEISMWLLVAQLTPTARQLEWRKLFTSPVLAILAALTLNFLGPTLWIPDFLHHTARMLGACAIPLSLLLVGAISADLLFHQSTLFSLPVMATACGLRCLLLPVLMMGAAWLLPLTPELRVVLIVQAAMPAAVFPVVLIRHHRGDTHLALAVVLSTSLLGLFTIPFWLKIGLTWISH